MEEDRQKWAENKRQWEEQRKADQQRWEEHRKEHAEWMNTLQEQGKKFDRKFDQTLGALGTKKPSRLISQSSVTKLPKP